MPCMQCDADTWECGPSVEGLCTQRMSAKTPAPTWEFQGYIECGDDTTINVYSMPGAGGCEVKLEVGKPEGDKCLWCEPEDVWQCGPDDCDDTPPWHFIGEAKPADCELNVYWRNVGGSCQVKVLPK